MNAKSTTWSMSEARSGFSELVRRALQEGPQHVTRRGKDCAVIVSRADFDLLEAGIDGAAEGPESATEYTEYKDFKDWLFNAPVDLSKLDLTRSADTSAEPGNRKRS
ncbi:MAG: type II toxin-antitoxin system Phd/YefM family antitoxin [Rhodospirillaceae bacterium]|nr:type II toxin-antitoxin system Phd/YefM family antitoxin [Rhodospirillaceae bacterium]MYF86834.1 type II toxin-antitoxin system Phd/YefM family antitoxin [Rhodospirillaceae bacterium]MYH38652.1 type II toxin-antitoxin system Phd/YefM family antitoxin [Rhodospirillaceae bacterium]MYK60226.1 type II toxin-antitoxin system Phd/YefM family antitoxin [Rhodospirillaceae bacterium]